MNLQGLLNTWKLYVVLLIDQLIVLDRSESAWIVLDRSGSVLDSLLKLFETF